MVSYVPEYLKSKNRKLVFDLFVQHKELSRAEIVQKTKMSFPTVSKAVDFMLSRNIIVEQCENPEVSQGRPGRKRKSLSFNSAAYCALAVNFEGQLVEIGVIDLSGYVLSYETRRFSNFTSHADMECLGKHLSQLLANAPCPVLGVGVGFPANVDCDTSRVISYDMLQQTSPVSFLELFAPMVRQLPNEIFVENDVNLAAMGEMLLRGGENKHNSLCYFTLGTGFGAGIVLNGKLWKGCGFRAGEIGNTKLYPIDTTGTSVPKAVILETVIGIKAINRQFDLNLLEEPELTMTQKLAIVDFIITPLTWSVYNAIMMLDIEYFVLAGLVPHLLGSTLIDAVREQVYSMLLLRGRTVEILPPIDRCSTLIGAASMVFEKTILTELQD